MQLELKRIQREVGITFIFVTHDQEEALTMSDRIAVMSNGQGRADRHARREIYDRPATGVRRRLHRPGQPAGPARSPRRVRPRATVDAARRAPSCAAGAIIASMPGGRDATLMVRPERRHVVARRRRRRGRDLGHGHRPRLPGPGRARRSCAPPTAPRSSPTSATTRDAPAAPPRRPRLAVAGARRVACVLPDAGHPLPPTPSRSTSSTDARPTIDHRRP